MILKNMTTFASLFLLFFIIEGLGNDSCICIPAPSSANTDGAYSTGSSECKEYGNSCNYYVNHEFKFLSYMLSLSGNDKDYLEANGNFTLYTSDWWVNFGAIYVPNYSKIHFNGRFHYQQNLTVQQFSLLLLSNRFSLGNILYLTSVIGINQPQLVSWGSNYIHLFKNTFGISVINGDGRCVDVISLNDKSNLNDVSSIEDPHFSSSDFPVKNMYLLSNSRLIRYCPSQDVFNNTVYCYLNGTTWATKHNYKYPESPYAFTYPHCPCSGDSKTDCYVVPIHSNTINLASTPLSDTSFVIDRNVTFTQGGVIKKVIMNNVYSSLNSYSSIQSIELFNKIIISKSTTTLSTTKIYNVNENQNFVYDSFGGYLVLNFLNSLSDSVLEITSSSTQYTILSNKNLFVKLNAPSSISIELNSGYSLLLLMSSNTIINSYETGYCSSVLMTSNSITCLSCFDYSIRLINQSCIYLPTIDHCSSYEYNNRCSTCEDHYYLSNDMLQCSPCSDNCKRCNFNSNEECIVCDDDYMLVNNKCQLKSNLCSFSTRNICLDCIDGYYFSEMDCKQNSIVGCIVQNQSFCSICSNDMTYVDNSCVTPSSVASVSSNYIVSCETGFYVLNNKCVPCSSYDSNCLECELNQCKKCSSTTVLIGTKCSLPPHCKKIDENKRCLECEAGYILDEDNSCALPIPDCLFQRGTVCLECIDSLIPTESGSCGLNVNECVKSSIFGCLRCGNGYYYESDSRTCEKCSSECKTCLTTSEFCLSCDSSSFLSDHKCKTSDGADTHCDTFLDNGGCIKCSDNYYRNGLECLHCLEACETCNNNETCLTCNEQYYMRSNNVCRLKSLLIGCSEKISSVNGCAKCSVGYYLKSKECYPCNETCLDCISDSQCVSCSNDKVLVGNRCNSLKEITNCKAIKESKCSRCAFWHSPSDDGTYCQTKVSWWFVGVCIAIILLIFILIGLVVHRLFVIIQTKINIRKAKKLVCLFEMRHSNVNFISLGTSKLMCVDKNVLVFNEENDGIPVSEESRALLCIGNRSNESITVQFTMKENVEKFLLRTEPQLVVIPPKMACEFEVFLEPKYTTTINENIIINCRGNKHNHQEMFDFTIQAVTELTTKLGYEEITKEKIIGEGAFGIVYKGKFRNCVVAIKTIKNIEFNKEAINEFTKEVEMLDKFRSEYIIHFYGAVFIPNKICIVTEFAQFGSIRHLILDSMKNRMPSEKLRLKLIFDAAKGIEYLHSNGILHRDIKPDNLLVVSMSESALVNAKLTDFGSSRNINLLMTNMTFTKGVGTPIYMAPEILNQQKYKMPADIYSFAITMYECFSWKDSYPINDERFKHPWSIADFVSEGKRLEKIDNITEDQFNLIQNCWSHEPENRLNISKVLEILAIIIDNAK